MKAVNLPALPVSYSHLKPPTGNGMGNSTGVNFPNTQHLLCVCHACERARLWRPEVDYLGIFLNHFSTLFFETGSLTEPGTHWFR